MKDQHKKIKFEGCKVSALLVEVVGSVSIVAATIGGEEVTLFEKEGEHYLFNEEYEFTLGDMGRILTSCTLFENLMK